MFWSDHGDVSPFSCSVAQRTRDFLAGKGAAEKFGHTALLLSLQISAQLEREVPRGGFWFSTFISLPHLRNSPTSISLSVHQSFTNQIKSSTFWAHPIHSLGYWCREGCDATSLLYDTQASADIYSLLLWDPYKSFMFTEFGISLCLEKRPDKSQGINPGCKEMGRKTYIGIQSQKSPALRSSRSRTYYEV